MTDPEALARYYDLDLEDDPGDLPLYEALAARTGGPILELAVGSGRIAVPLALAGYDVTGVDSDPHMLERARRTWERRPPASRGSLRLVEADLITSRIEERFGLVILALNSLLLLDERERQVAALHSLAAHLRPDGLAVVDVWLPAAEDLTLYDGRLQLEWLRPDPETGAEVAKLASACYDAATATVVLTQLFDATPRGGGPLSRVARTDRMRLVAAAELTAMAREAGLAVEETAGDHQMAPFGPGAERVIVIVRLV